jgi:hypothetical protein
MVQFAADSELVAQSPEDSQVIELLQPPVEQPSWRQRIAVAAGFVAVSGGAFWSEQVAHLSERLPQPEQTISESMAHPAIGNAGALLCTTIVAGKFVGEQLGNSRLGLATRQWIGEHMLASSLAVATVGDAAVEVLQSAIITNGPVFSSFTPQQLPETGKDYLFTVLGVGAYRAHSRFYRWWHQHRQTGQADSAELVTELISEAA